MKIMSSFLFDSAKIMAAMDTELVKIQIRNMEFVIN